MSQRGGTHRALESRKGAPVTTMTDAQVVKVFSLTFTCEVIAALHRDIRRNAEEQGAEGASES